MRIKGERQTNLKKKPRYKNKLRNSEFLKELEPEMYLNLSNGSFGTFDHQIKHAECNLADLEN